MQVLVRRFGRPGREQLGLLQPAETLTADGARVSPAFLLCRPLGQEAIRTCAMYRSLSDQLARKGCNTLRFDYHGTGDSPGEECMQSLGTMIDDTLAAHELLLESFPGQPVHWFGLALGANVALRAVARARVAPAHLVLWEPVLEGEAYLAALLDAHRSELARELGYTWPQLVRSGRETEPELPGEVLGFEYGAQLVDEMRALGALPLAAAARRGTSVTCVVGADQVAAIETLLEQAPTPRVTIKAAEMLVNWKSTEALGSAIAPRDVAQTVLATLDQPPATLEGLVA